MLKDIFNAGIFWSNKNNSRSFMGKIKISIISIALGIAFGLLIIAILGYNPFVILRQVIMYGFKSKNQMNTLFIVTTIYGLSGLANAFAFKTGLFNIGVSGQMIAGGATSMFLGLVIFNSISAAIAIPILIIISILVAGLVGLLVGFLKSQFNVHEVVSTILLNWVIFYLFKFIFRPNQSFVGSDGNSNWTSYNLYFGGNTTNAYIASLTLMLIMAIAIFALLKFTTFGRTLKITGLNKEASKAFGINPKFAIMSSLVISASIAGILGFVYYFARQHFVAKFTTTLPNYGFDGIAIALLAFNSPFAIPIIAFLYGIFQTGAAGTTLPSSIQNETVMLIFSIVIYFSAISALFIRFKPIRFIRLIILIKINKEALAMKTSSSELIENIKNEEIAKINKIQKEIELIKNDKNLIKYKTLVEDYKSLKDTLNIRIKSIKKENIINMIKLIDDKTQFKIVENYHLSKYYFLKSSYQKYIFTKNQFIIKNQNSKKFSASLFKKEIDNIKKSYKNWINLNKAKQKKLKIEYRKKLLSKSQYIEQINKLINSKIKVERGQK